MITMATSEVAPAAQKKAKTVTAKPKKAAGESHPKVSQMALAAITQLKDRGGSSLQAIKKYMASTYKVDSEKLSPFIKKYLKTAVASGSLHQTKGKGATGSFKLMASAPAKKIVRPKKIIAVNTTEKPRNVSKKLPEKKRVAKPKKVKAPKKEKKARAPKKLKTPKPKKAAKKTSKK